MAEQVLVTTILSATTLAPTATNFLGFEVLEGGSIRSSFCSSGWTFGASANYGRCCTSGDACTTRSTCTPCSTSTNECKTQTIYDQLPLNGRPGTLRYLCAAPGWTRNSLYKAIVTTSSTTSTITSGSTPSSQPAPSTTPSSAIPTVSSPPDEDTPSGGSSSSSNAWIAGAVVGPIALIVIAALLFWIYKLKKNKAASKGEGATPYADPKYAPVDPAPQDVPPPQEMPGDEVRQPVEVVDAAKTKQTPRYELG